MAPGLAGGTTVFRTNKIDDVWRASHRHHRVFIKDHPDQHVTREHLLLGGLTTAVFFNFDRRCLRDLDLKDASTHPQRHGALLKGGLDLFLAA